jgi:hypothetical protein
MDTTLVTVTLISMAMAASLSVIVWRMLRDERQRSDARVIALTAKARPAAPPRPTRLDLPIRETPMPASLSSTAMFAERESESPWGHRAAVMAGLGLVLASVVRFALAASGRSREVRPQAAPAAAASAQPAAATPAAAGLELLSLRDARDAGTLTITGLVHNPRGGAPLSRVTVTAYAFDDKGSFLASGRAPLEVAVLTPGDDSPFVVTVPVTEAVARYRIGFRGEDGRVIAHVDKRQQAAVAALGLGSGQANW